MSMLGLTAGLGEVSSQFTKMTQWFNSDKTKKASENMTHMFKSMGSASIKTWALEQLMKLIDPFIMLLKPLEPLFTILGGLFKMMVGEAIKPMIEFLKPLFKILMELSPIFKVIGQVIGKLMTIGLIPLKVTIELIAALLKPFMPLFEKLAPIFDLLTPIISQLIKYSLIPLAFAFYGIAKVIAFVVDTITAIIDGIDFLNITPIRGTQFGAGVDQTFAPIFSELLGLQSGGYVLPSQGGTIARIAEGGEGEHVIPDSKFDSVMQDLLYEMKLNNEYNKQYWQYKQFKGRR